MTIKDKLDEVIHYVDPSNIMSQMSQQLHLPELMRERGFLPLLLSTALAEVSGNIVYMVLLERAYQLGGQAASVGGLLLVQSAPQVFLGTWAGNLVDRLGKRRAAILATIAYSALVAILMLGRSILFLFTLAFLLMLVRLTLTPARLALVSQISSKGNLVAANTALSAVTSMGLFLGPAISAALILLAKGFNLSLFIACLGLLLSTLPLLLVPKKTRAKLSPYKSSMWKEMQIGWQFIRQHGSIWKVLLCLMHFILVMGAVTPLINPLSHDLDMGAEGASIFFAVIGFGGLLGATLAVALAKGLGTSFTLMFTGMLAPIGILIIGLTYTESGAIYSFLVTALAGNSLNVIVFSVIQRLTPLEIQGRVFGVQQTLVGSVWLISLAVTTGVLFIWRDFVNIQLYFLLIGAGGLGIFLTCWFKHWRPITAACKMCEPSIKVFGVVCQVICSSNLKISGAACRVICGSPVRCCY